MKLPSLVKLPKNRGFKYKPHYYDPVKEELEERVRKIKSEMGDSEENYRPRISFRRTEHQKSSQQGMLLRLVLVVFMALDVWIYAKYGYSKMLQLILLAEVFFGYIWFRFGKRFM